MRLRPGRPRLRQPELFSDSPSSTGVDVSISKDESLDEELRAIHDEMDDTQEVVEPTEDELYLELPRSYKGNQPTLWLVSRATRSVGNSMP
jgi:hypothetical protein